MAIPWQLPQASRPRVDGGILRTERADTGGFAVHARIPAESSKAFDWSQTVKRCWPPSITRRLIEEYVRRAPEPGDRPRVLDELTARESEVLTLVGRGLSNQQTAEQLVVSTATVKTHVNRLFAKLGVRDRVQAVVLAYEAGVVRPGDATR